MSSKIKGKPIKTISTESLRQININAAGIDIGSELIHVCVPEDRDESPVREFQSFTEDLYSILEWLKACNVTSAAMESTSIYWVPLYDILDRNGISVCLVNPSHIKNVPGRKTDIKECQWIQQLHSYGLLRASVIPDEQIRELREFDKQREMLINYRSSHTQHMQKALHSMNLKLDRVISDITGMTGMSIIRAIIAGQRDPLKLAKFRDRRCKNPEDVIAKSLYGDYKEEHIFQLQQAVELYDLYTEKIQECNTKIEQVYEKLPKRIDSAINPLPVERNKSKRSNNNSLGFGVRKHLYEICGVDLTKVDGLDEISVHKIISRMGTEMSQWRTEKHFCSWLTLAPHQDKSGGKVLRSKTLKSKNQVANVLRQCARSLHHSDSALGAYYRRMRTKLGTPKAIVAAAHKLARIIYNMLKNQTEYNDIGAQEYNEIFKERRIKYLHQAAKKYGYIMTPVDYVLKTQEVS